MSAERVRRVQERQDARRVAQGLPAASGQQAETDARVLQMAEQNPGDAQLQEIAGQVEDRLRSN